MSNIGHNRTPYDDALDDLEDVKTEAAHWLDGGVVDSQEEADSIALLLDMARTAKKSADTARKEEKRPHDEAGRAVQEKYRPLLSEADLITKACKQALTPWLQKLDAEQRAIEAAARKAAEEKARAASEASRSSLEDKLKADQLAQEAAAAKAVEDKASNSKAHAKGGARAVGLRTSYEPEVNDLGSAMRHYWEQDRQAFAQLILQLARKDIGRGKHTIPGITIHERKAVA